MCVLCCKKIGILLHSDLNFQCFFSHTAFYRYLNTELESHSLKGKLEELQLQLALRVKDICVLNFNSNYTACKQMPDGPVFLSI